MAIKKTQLYSSLWESANKLRGGMDPSMYKDYVLSILFVKYVSDKYKDDPYADFVIPDGGSFSDMVIAKEKTNIGERINIIITKLAEANDLVNIIDRTDFDDSEKLGKGKEKVTKLTSLISIFENSNLDFSKNQSGNDDILGDVYEYFMKHFASESGKSKGQFYTPSEVSRIMAKVIGVDKATSAGQTAYDMTCGSGSLLLKVASESPVDITLYGQEKDIAVSVLAKMNMILHDQPTAEIKQGNTLADPEFKDEGGILKRFDFCVANPPFSEKSWTDGVKTGNDDPFNRFVYGTPPEKNGDYAFFSHFIKSLKHTGSGAIILPHGVLFRGNKEENIRKKIIEKGYIKAIIGLPSNLFFGTGIPAVILIIDKENASARKGIFMIDASNGYIKDGNKNKLRERDVHQIVDTFLNFSEIEKYSKMVSFEEIQKNDFNLNIPRYIDNSEEEDVQDIFAHLNGGIPNKDIEKIQSLNSSFKEIKNKIFNKDNDKYSSLKIKEDTILDAIFDSEEFKKFNIEMKKVFLLWKKDNISIFENINSETSVKEFIKSISNSILESFKEMTVVDEYAIFQSLMTYWDETMQDDLYIIKSDGWVATPYRIIETNKKDKEVDKGWTCDLLPKNIVIDEYFNEEKEEINNLKQEQDTLLQNIDNLKEEFGGEEDALFEVEKKVDAENGLNQYLSLAFKEYLKEKYGNLKDIQKKQENTGGGLIQIIDELPSEVKNKGKVVIKLINEKKKDSHVTDSEKELFEKYQKINKNNNSLKKEYGELFNELKEEIFDLIKEDEKRESLKQIKILQDFLSSLEKEAVVKKEIKEKEQNLDDNLLKKYPELTKDEVKKLVVHNKWIAYLEKTIEREQEKISQDLSQKIKSLSERYETPLKDIESEVKDYEKKVKEHLKKMGFNM